MLSAFKVHLIFFQNPFTQNPGFGFIEPWSSLRSQHALMQVEKLNRGKFRSDSNCAQNNSCSRYFQDVEAKYSFCLFQEHYK